MVIKIRMSRFGHDTGDLPFHGGLIYPPFGQEHLENPVKIASSFFRAKGGATRNMPAPPIEASVRYQDMEMMIESQEMMALSERALSTQIISPGCLAVPDCLMPHLSGRQPSARERTALTASRPHLVDKDPSIRKPSAAYR